MSLISTSSVSRADQVSDLQRVSRLLREHVAAPGAGDNKKLFLAAADALDQRASKLNQPKRPSLRLVDITC